MDEKCRFRTLGVSHHDPDGEIGALFDEDPICEPCGFAKDAVQNPLPFPIIPPRVPLAVHRLPRPIWSGGGRAAV